MSLRALDRINGWRRAHPTLFGYAAAVGSLILALALTIAVVRGLGFRPQPLTGFFFLSALLFTAWFGGYGPGLLICVLSYTAVPYLFVPTFSFASIDPLRVTLTVTASLLVSRIASVRRQAEKALLDANKVLEAKVAERTADLARERDRYQALAGHLLKLQENERRHLSREIHDSLGQELTSIKFQLQALALSVQGQTAEAPIHPVLSSLDQLIVKLREVASNLRPPILDHLSLPDALEWLADQFRSRTGMNIAADIQQAIPPVQDDVKMALFRICQEALTNTVRHSKASEIKVTLHVNGDLTMTIQDNGTGFDVAHPSAHLGLLGMHERAETIGAALKVDSVPGKGTTVSLLLSKEWMGQVKVRGTAAD